MRCESPDCIAPASVALSYGDLPGDEFLFCRRHFDLIEERCASVSVERKELLAMGVSERMADHIMSARIGRRAV